MGDGPDKTEVAEDPDTADETGEVEQVPTCVISRSYGRAVAVSKEAFDKLDAIVSSFAKSSPRYSVLLTDDSALAFKSIAALAAFENSRARAIRRVRVSAGVEGRTVTVEINARPTDKKPVSLDITGPDDEVAKFLPKLEAWLSDVQEGPVYSAFARQNRGSIIFGLFLFFWLGPTIVLTVVSLARGDFALMKPSNETSSSLGFVLITTYFLVPPFLFGTLINRLRAAYWPVACFLIGQGEKRHSRMESSRDRWFLGVIGLIVGIVGLAISIKSC